MNVGSVFSTGPGLYDDLSFNLVGPSSPLRQQAPSLFGLKARSIVLEVDHPYRTVGVPLAQQPRPHPVLTIRTANKDTTGLLKDWLDQRINDLSDGDVQKSNSFRLLAFECLGRRYVVSNVLPMSLQLVDRNGYTGVVIEFKLAADSWRIESDQSVPGIINGG